MVKRKQNQFLISIDIARWGIVLALVAAVIGISYLAMFSYVRRSGLFNIKEVAVSEKIGKLDIPEFDKLKGKNIFVVDLEGLQTKISGKYPQIAGLKVLRRFPDEISIQGERRIAVALVLVDGRSVAVSHDGYFIGAPSKEDSTLVLVKGLQKQKSSAGTRVKDLLLENILSALDWVRKDRTLTGYHLHAIDVTDISKLVFSFGEAADPARFDVFVDKDNCVDKMKVLSVMLVRNDLAVNEIKYIDLRFNPPVIGKKKVKK